MENLRPAIANLTSSAKRGTSAAQAPRFIQGCDPAWPLNDRCLCVRRKGFQIFEGHVMPRMRVAA